MVALQGSGTDEGSEAFASASQARGNDSESFSNLVIFAGIRFSAAFTGLIWFASGRLQAISHLPDQGASWYYWILPEPTFWSRTTAWGFYAAHQIAQWALIYHAQVRVRKYTRGLHPVNVAALGMNAGFIALHFVQTHIWYDGLAQDVSIWSALGSVAILLIWVLLMENDRRGLFFAKPLPFSRRLIKFARKYHGYYFSWAIVYTFWYHPMEATSGHLIGFFYMFLLMVQGSLFLTRMHVNRWWMVFLEVTVLIHGAIVAYWQETGIWPMFAFGFATMFIVTQMHGLGLSRIARAGIGGVYVAAMAMVYADRGLAQLNEVVRIPTIDYLGVVLLAGILWVVMKFATRPHADALDTASGPA